MSNLSGVVDMLDEHPPELIVTQHGSVLVSVDECVSLRFRTMAALDAWLEDVDRQRAACGDQQTLGGDLISLLERSVEQAEIRKLHRGGVA